MFPAVPKGTAGKIRRPRMGLLFSFRRSRGEHFPCRFIDGGYWAAVLRDEFGLPKIDLVGWSNS